VNNFGVIINSEYYKIQHDLGFTSILNYHIASLELTLPLLHMEQAILWEESHARAATTKIN